MANWFVCSLLIRKVEDSITGQVIPKTTIQMVETSSMPGTRVFGKLCKLPIIFLIIYGGRVVCGTVYEEMQYNDLGSIQMQ